MFIQIHPNGSGSNFERNVTFVEFNQHEDTKLQDLIHSLLESSFYAGHIPIIASLQFIEISINI